MKKPEIVFVCQNKIGGVQNYYYNLLRANQFDGFCTRVIYVSNSLDHETRLPQLFQSAKEEIVFEHKGDYPVYASFRRLHKLIGKHNGIVFTNFPFELGCLQTFGASKAVAFVVHDEWYIQNAIRYSFLIDVFIAHNPSIFALLNRILPDRKDDIYYLPYGISMAKQVRQANLSDPLKILFIGRLHTLKGIFDIPVIDDILKENGIICDWTIIGDGPEKENLYQAIKGRSNFRHFSPATNDEVLKIASEHDVFVLPSRLEGLPVSLLEAMSAGLVPVIGNFNEGISTVVTSEIGFVLPMGDTRAFAESIGKLGKNRQLLDTMGEKARLKVRDDYDAITNANAYYELAKRYADLISPRKTNLPFNYGNGRLDKPYLPSFLATSIRRIINLFH
jgi:glycosyltransferase involved in cell wall biosynthesis